MKIQAWLMVCFLTTARAKCRQEKGFRQLQKSPWAQQTLVKASLFQRNPLNERKFANLDVILASPMTKQRRLELLEVTFVSIMQIHYPYQLLGDLRIYQFGEDKKSSAKKYCLHHRIFLIQAIELRTLPSLWVISTTGMENVVVRLRYFSFWLNHSSTWWFPWVGLARIGTY